MSTYPKNTKNGIVYDYWHFTWYIEIIKNAKSLYRIAIYNKEKNIIKTAKTQMYL